MNEDEVVIKFYDSPELGNIKIGLIYFESGDVVIGESKDYDYSYVKLKSELMKKLEKKVKKSVKTKKKT